jgi:hypothetical protein
MATIEVTRLARDALQELIKTRELPLDTGKRVSRSLLTLEEFPRAGKQLSGVWRDCRALIGLLIATADTKQQTSSPAVAGRCIGRTGG